MLLALDTSSDRIAAAIADRATGEVRAAVQADPGLRHAEQLAPVIRDLASETGGSIADLTGVAVGVGPGPFTGLRVGLVTARVLGAALGIPVTGYCSLDVIARAYADRLADQLSPAEFVVATDARRKEVYWAGFRGRERLTGPDVTKPAELAEVLAGRTVVGTGARLYPEWLAGAVTADPAADERGDATVDAGVLARAAIAGELVEFEPEPLYLRRPDVHVSAGPKSVL